MNQHQLGLGLVALGAGLAVLGLVVMTGALRWFGRLPGDVHVEREGFRLYAPFVSMLLLSAIATLVLWIIRRLR
jgi:hypothetical protein